jgi:hypothetical protein
MSPGDESQQDTLRVLRDLIAAFSGPHGVHPAHAEHVVALAAELLDAAQEPGGRTARPSMPTSVWPRSAVFEEPDEPPVPPGAL